MRTRLLTAVLTLLADPVLAGARHSVTATAVVLLAKSPVASPAVRTRASELGRWVGASESYLDHHVLPDLRRRGAVRSRATKDEEHQVDGLELTLVALVRAREEGAAHPLSLSRRELATLLRLAEAVFGPGWAPKEGPETPAGLLGGRRGRGAGSDRLVLLLLVLLARPNGRVVMAPGSVAAGHGRAAATVARHLDCPLVEAQRIVDRLVEAGLIQVVGEGSRERLVVPAVAAAHRAVGAGPASAGGMQDMPPVAGGGSAASGCVHCDHCSAVADAEAGELSGEGFVQESFDDALEGLQGELIGALRVPADSDVAAEATETLGAVAIEEVIAAGATVDAGALLHTNHPDVVVADSSSDGDHGCSSGDAALGCALSPDRAHPGEDATWVEARSDGSASAARGPLRGEKPGCAGDPDWLWSQGAGGVPRDLAAVLQPVLGLWARMVRRGQQRWLAGLVRTELGRITDLVGQGRAVRVLAARLERRQDELCGAIAADPVAWLLSRGLPQRQGCWSVLCDDGRRLNTGLACDSCEAVLGDRRELRARIRSEVAAELAGLGTAERRVEVERRLNLGVRRQAVMDMIRRERGTAEAELRREAVALLCEDLAAERAEQASRPCTECGVDDADGLCLGCTSARHVAAAVEGAVDVAVAMRADLNGPEAVPELAARIMADTLVCVDAAGDAVDTDDPAVREWTRYSAARTLRTERTRKALYWLERGSVADRAAWMAIRVTRQRASQYASSADLLEAAAKAAAKARVEAAAELLGELLADVRRVKPVVVVGRPLTDWTVVLRDLAGRPLTGDASTVSAGPARAVLDVEGSV